MAVDPLDPGQESHQHCTGLCTTHLFQSGRGCSVWQIGTTLEQGYQDDHEDLKWQDKMGIYMDLQHVKSLHGLEHD